MSTFSEQLRTLLLGALGTPEARDELIDIIQTKALQCEQEIINYDLGNGFGIITLNLIKIGNVVTCNFSGAYSADPGGIDEIINGTPLPDKYLPSIAINVLISTLIGTTPLVSVFHLGNDGFFNIRNGLDSSTIFPDGDSFIWESFSFSYIVN